MATICPGIFFTIATMISLTFGGRGDELVTIEFEVPTFLQILFGKIMNSYPLMRTNAINLNWDSPNKDKDNFLIRITSKGLEDIARRAKERKEHKERRPHVEIGPGMFKTEIVTYPPHFLENRIKYLLQIKENQTKAKEALLNNDDN